MVTSHSFTPTWTEQGGARTGEQLGRKGGRLFVAERAWVCRINGCAASHKNAMASSGSSLLESTRDGSAQMVIGTRGKLQPGSGGGVPRPRSRWRFLGAPVHNLVVIQASACIRTISSSKSLSKTRCSIVPSIIRCPKKQSTSPFHVILASDIELVDITILCTSPSPLFL